MSEQTYDDTTRADVDTASESQADSERADDTGTGSAAPEGDDQAAHTPEVERLLSQLHKKNREAANLRARVAQAEPAAQDTAAALDRAQRAESERDELLSALTRERVARRYHLPDELADRLKGDDEQELAADAEALSKLLGRSDRVDVGQGQRAQADADPNTVFRRLARDAP